MVLFLGFKTEKCKTWWKNSLFLLFFCSLIAACGGGEVTSQNVQYTPEQYRSIGAQIRKARLQQNMSQKELASAVHISQNALSLIEDGMATPIHYKITAIEEYLGIELIIDAGMPEE